ncbi:MAG TPA: DUF2336 domain-containing protein [Rhizomicrobium sp.]|nr:DUF2336 domain-containing protein [Rhizomicrobium sp.]
MNVGASLLPELEQVVQHGSTEKRAKTLRRIANLFLEGAPTFNAQHVALFDEIIGYLIEDFDIKALAELARRIAPVPNAPHGIVVTLAKNDDISVAGPILKQARIDDQDLKYIAETKSQAHLLAMSTRTNISEALADVLVQRGDREVACAIAINPKARLSESALSTLVKRAERDNGLAEKVGLRSDIPSRLFRQLLLHASEVAQKRLLVQAKPEMQAEIHDVLAKVTEEPRIKSSPRDYIAAMATLQALNKERKLTEADVANCAKNGMYDETIAALAIISVVPVEVVDRLVSGERFDPVLILSRAAGFTWRTVREIICSRPGFKPSRQILDVAQENFDRLTVTTAQRVVRFWQVRQDGGE